MAETVYLETSIFSFYHERRSDPEAVAMREWTRTWWEHLANANKAGHIRWINTVLGLYVPMLITPLQLIGE